ncbi:hypothetical protein [Vacuolonema iberomarrocanum]|uniref:hypothetical protein n=1 Tax=Vacuolonema iberomarrocanum TaxID=3454632 RepID=UPI001A103DAE|nr:hypothetical protein [filamentous cyanobacterium LEGE 07170]
MKRFLAMCLLAGSLSFVLAACFPGSESADPTDSIDEESVEDEGDEDDEDGDDDDEDGDDD